MAESFDAFRYIGYLRAHWRTIAISCATAVTIAAAVSLILPNQYTATARIVIEPPAGTDPRATLAVSPIYLESLRTYEQFASSDSLFQRAVEKLGLRSGPIESQKRRVLKVSLLRNTRVLEIAVTLPDPRKAQALAEFLSQATIEISRSLTNEGDGDLVQGIAQQQRDLQQKLEGLNAAWADTAAREPIQMLQAQSENAAKLRAALDQQLSAGELEIADAAERLKGATGGDAAEIRKQESNARARLAQVRQQIQSLEKEGAERERLLAARLSKRERMEAERKSTVVELTAVVSQLREARGGAAYRGERLKVIDPGIVPERPSSPNIPLTVAAALLLGLALPVLWLTLRMGLAERSEDTAPMRSHARWR
jgi:succinoglycan biosynthesis transport protein ExoP